MKRQAVSALAAAATSLVLAIPAGAAGPGATHVSMFDPTGAVFTCPGASYTVLGGSVRSVFHYSVAADGSEHVSVAETPIGVTLTDGTTDAVYRLAGASPGSGNFSEVSGQFVFTDPSHFNIIGPSGGVVAEVAGVEHASSGGSNFVFTFGPCQAPDAPED